MKSALIFAAGVEESPFPLPPQGTRPWVVCADGGYRLCRRFQLLPDVVIGDLDSLTQQDLEEIEQGGVAVERHSCDKDESDLELALRWVHARGVKDLWMLGLLGGRMDHCLFNLVSVLGLSVDLEMHAIALSAQGEFRIVAKHVTIKERKGWTCSLLPLSPQVSGVSLSGFRYPLTDETLYQSKTLTLSNRVEEELATVRVVGGRLLMMLIPQEAVCSIV